MNFLVNLKNGIVHHSPEILTGIGIAGMISAGVMAVRATPKALILIEEEKTRINAQMQREADIRQDAVVPVVTKLTRRDTIRVTWRCYIPSIIMTALGVTCLVGSNSINLKRNASLAAAYSLTDIALRDYQKKVVETIGEKKEQTVKEEVAEDIIQRKPVETQEIIVANGGDTLCFDVVSSRYFYSDMETIKRAENEINKRLRDEMYEPLNDFYYEIGLEPTSIGDDIGWNINRDGYLDITYASKIATNGKPCLVIQYQVAPRYDYRDLY